jgi:uncharacterized protein (DUF736 family)
MEPIVEAEVEAIKQGVKLLVEIRPNLNKTNDRQPDFRVYAANNVEIGSARKKVGQDSQGKYVALHLAVPEFGPRRLFCDLGPAAGQDDKDVFAFIWNPEN